MTQTKSRRQKIIDFLEMDEREAVRKYFRLEKLARNEDVEFFKRKKETRRI